MCEDGSCSWRPRQLLVTRLTLRGWGGVRRKMGLPRSEQGPGRGGVETACLQAPSEKPGPAERGGSPLLLNGASGINQEVRTDICVCSVASGESDSL